MDDNRAFLEALNEYKHEFPELGLHTNARRHDVDYCYGHEDWIAPGIMIHLCMACGYVEYMPEESRRAQVDAGQLELWEDKASG